ncbi:MAG: hypothetical protein R2909_06905 [Gemmatimonadales bacterium]
MEFYLSLRDYPENRQAVRYRHLVRTPMPAIPPATLNTVAYLFETEEAAVHGVPSDGATAFLVFVPPTTDAMGQEYVVTNGHVLGSKSELWVRLWGPTQEPFCIPATAWMRHPDPNNDVVVAPVPSGLRGDLRVVLVESFVAKDQHSIGPGSDVFMVSRFLSHDGGPANQPAVRFGTIAMMPNRPVPFDLPDGSRIDQVSYLVEMHSIGGHSGSPVFVSPFSYSAPHLAAQWVATPRLLGMDCGHFTREEKVDFGHGRSGTIRVNSGMAVVLPAWRILEVLHLTPLVDARRAGRSPSPSSTQPN